MTLSFVKHNENLQKAFSKVATSKNGDAWVIFDYEGNTNVIKVGDEGDYGLEEFATSFNSGRLQYGVVSVRLSPTVLPKIVLVRWQGEGVPISRLSGTTHHAEDMKRYLKTVHIMIEARNEIDVDPESIKREVAKLPGTLVADNVESSYTAPSVVGSVYKPVKPHMDINLKDRDQFWEKMRAEETKRKTEEEAVEKKKQKQWTSEQCELDSNIHKRMEAMTVSSLPKSDENRACAAPIPKSSFSSSSHAPEAHAFSQNDSSISDDFSQSLDCQRQNNFVHRTLSAKEDPVAPVVGMNTVAANPSAQLLRNDLYEVPPQEGLSAVALWDYQAADDTEISFDPDEIITEIEQVDEGWWKGRGPRGGVGLFPANYVRLL